MKGEYTRAIEGATPDSRAAILNNAGFAVMLGAIPRKPRTCS